MARRSNHVCLTHSEAFRSLANAICSVPQHSDLHRRPNRSGLRGGTLTPRVNIAVGAIFAVVISGFVFTQYRNRRYHEQMKNLQIETIARLSFFQNSLRNPRDLDLPIVEKSDLGGFLAAIQNLQPTGRAIKSLKLLKRYPMRLEIRNNDKSLFSITIYRAEQTGDIGIVTLDHEGSIFTASGGAYQSEKLLKWVEKIGKRKGFEAIEASF